jgi:hypothetical protein
MRMIVNIGRKLLHGEFVTILSGFAGLASLKLRASPSASLRRPMKGKEELVGCIAGETGNKNSDVGKN